MFPYTVNKIRMKFCKTNENCYYSRMSLLVKLRLNLVNWCNRLWTKSYVDVIMYKNWARIIVKICTCYM